MNISISITPELAGFIKTKVESGRYTSSSEVVREALRLLERAEERGLSAHQRLLGAWHEGMASGDAGPLEFAAVKAEASRRLGGKTKS